MPSERFGSLTKAIRHQSTSFLLGLYFLSAPLLQGQDQFPTPPDSDSIHGRCVFLADRSACLQYSNDLRKDCANSKGDPVALTCLESVSCYEDKSFAIEAYDTACKFNWQSPNCKQATRRRDDTMKDDCDNPPPREVPKPNPNWIPTRYDILWMWIPSDRVHNNTPELGKLLYGAHDRDQQQDLYVCEVSLVRPSDPLHVVATVPGKLLKGLCNVAYALWGGEIPQYSTARIMRDAGYWAGPNGDFSKVLRTGTGLGRDNTLLSGGGETFYVCRANYTTKESALGPLFPYDADHGTHIGRLVRGECYFEWGGREVSSTRNMEVYYMLPPPVSPSPRAPTTDPTQGGSHIMEVSYCTVNPSTIALGGQATLTVRLSSSAPPGGMQVAIQISSNGSLYTLLNTPRGLPVSAGQTETTFLLQTQNVTNPASRITFYAFTAGSPAKQCELNIH